MSCVARMPHVLSESLCGCVRVGEYLCGCCAGVSISSDFISGFCGETEDDHLLTIQVDSTGHLLAPEAGARQRSARCKLRYWIWCWVLLVVLFSVVFIFSKICFSSQQTITVYVLILVTLPNQFCVLDV